MNMQPFLFVRVNGRYEKVKFSELILVRGRRGYMQLVTENKTYLVLNKMSTVQEHLPAALFCRIHRSYIVAIERIRAFDNHTVYLHEPPPGKLYNPGLARVKELPLGYHFRQGLRGSVDIMPNRAGVHTNLLEEAAFTLEGEEM
jgi:hypothetical protein